MSTDNEKKLDDFTRKTFLKAGLQAPPQSLLKNVMLMVGKSPLFVYKPLIGKTTWFAIAFTAIAIPLIVSYLGIESSFFGRDINILPFSIKSTVKLPELALSKTTMAIIVMAGILVIIQVHFLRNWHKNQLKRLG